MQECPSWKREVGRIPTLGDAGVTSDGAEKEIRGNVRFLVGRGFDVLEQMDSGVNYNQLIAERLGMSKKDSLMALRRLREMGLIFQSKEGEQGRKEYGLTDDGMRALIAYRTLPCADLRVEIGRMMGLEGRKRLSDEERSRIREAVKRVIKSNPEGAYNHLEELRTLLQDIEALGVEIWFDEDSLLDMMKGVLKRELPPPAMKLAIRLSGKLISVTGGYQKWSPRLRSLIDPLKGKAVDGKLDKEVRLESINALRRYRTPMGGIPKGAFDAFIDIMKRREASEYSSYHLEGQAIDEILREWGPLLDGEQRAMLTELGIAVTVIL
jgi:DNA-binding PadR family transcriptional regulator